MARHNNSPVTIYEVADKAGVAISTVSRVLNDSSDVAESTRERVLEVIDELKYLPNRVARSLAQRDSRVIAIATPTFTTAFHNSLLKGLRTVLADITGECDLLLFDLGSKNPLDRLRDKLKGGKVDGLILAGIPVSPPLAKELKAFDAPVILIGNHHTEFDCFYWDDFAGAEKATTHLLERGHHRIGLIRAYTDGYVQLQRIQGYKKALKKHKVRFDSKLIQSGSNIKHAGFSEEHGLEAMNELLKISPPVTAVLASSDVHAIGAWKAIREANKRVPQDISLIGYDDIKTSYYIELSSVDQRIEETGRLAAERLLTRQQNPSDTTRIDHKIDPKLQIRKSSNYNRSNR
ncbi:MAG: LacI family DNA-binding transcriptional regulator [Bacteroidetes bacterium]|nr:LacI family DNA-binding transcriptional regulator [Bacteroidota bacterium]MCY4205247.1 LacI family DNA-binding transcriptional regulator [Bacteroidota bacterium]